MMNKPFRWGVLSTARIARRELIPAFPKTKSNAELYAIASSNTVVDDIAEEFRIPKIFPSYEAMLEDNSIDAVYIPLPNSLHHEWSVKAAKHGKHVLCEKPAGLNFKEIQSTIDTFRNNNLVFIEAFMYQFHPQHAYVKELIAKGAIGTLESARAVLTFHMINQKDFRLSPEYGGGSLYDVGCYCTHSLTHVLGRKPKKILVHNIDEDQVDMRAQGMVEFEDNIIATFETSFTQRRRGYYEIIGSEGRILVPHAFEPQKNYDVGVVILEKEGEKAEKHFEASQFALEIDHLTYCAEQGLVPEAEWASTVQNMKVLEAGLTSLREGRWVTIS